MSLTLSGMLIRPSESSSVAPDSYRISMRSKGDVDVNSVATRFGGGGHCNAAGCSLDGPYADVRARLLAELTRALS